MLTNPPSWTTANPNQEGYSRFGTDWSNVFKLPVGERLPAGGNTFVNKGNGVADFTDAFGRTSSYRSTDDPNETATRIPSLGAFFKQNYGFEATSPTYQSAVTPPSTQYLPTVNYPSASQTAPLPKSQYSPSIAGATDRNVDSTVEGRVEGLLSRSSPVLKQVENRTFQQFADRGLLNSSMAVQAANEAVVSRAIDIAKPDAEAFQRYGLANKDAQDRFATAANAQKFGLESAAYADVVRTNTSASDAQVRAAEAARLAQVGASQAERDSQLRGSQASRDAQARTDQLNQEYNLRGTLQTQTDAAATERARISEQSRLDVNTLNSSKIYVDSINTINADYNRAINSVQIQNLPQEDKAAAIETLTQVRNESVAAANRVAQTLPGWQASWAAIPTTGAGATAGAIANPYVTPPRVVDPTVLGPLYDSEGVPLPRYDGGTTPPLNAAPAPAPVAAPAPAAAPTPAATAAPSWTTANPNQAGAARLGTDLTNAFNLPVGERLPVGNNTFVNRGNGLAEFTDANGRTLTFRNTDNINDIATRIPALGEFFRQNYGFSATQQAPAPQAGVLQQPAQVAAPATAAAPGPAPAAAPVPVAVQQPVGVLQQPASVSAPAPAAAQTTGTTAATQNLTIAEVTAFVTPRLGVSEAGNREVYDAGYANRNRGVTLAMIDAAGGMPPGTSAAWAAANGLPVF